MTEESQIVKKLSEIDENIKIIMYLLSELLGENSAAILISKLAEDKLRVVPHKLGAIPITKITEIEKFLDKLKKSRLIERPELTPALASFLEILKKAYKERKRGVTIEEMANLTNKHPATAASYLKRLYNMGFIERKLNLNPDLKAKYIYVPKITELTELEKNRN